MPEGLTVSFRERESKNIYIFDVLCMSYDSEDRVFSAKAGTIIVNIETDSYNAHGSLLGNGDEMAKECLVIAKNLSEVYR